MNKRRRLGLVTAALGAVAACSFAASGYADTVVVTTMSEDGWLGLNEGPANSVGETVFSPGPDKPPAGIGSATLQVDDNGRASFGTTMFKGTPLANVTELTFSSYSSSALTTASVGLQIDVDYDSSDSDTTYQGRLVFEPAGAPTPDTWVWHDAITGTWWASKAPGQTECPQNSPCTWAQILAAFPNVAVRNDPIQQGTLLLRLGGPIGGGAIASVDNLTFAAGFPSTTFDFEPGASVNPSVGRPASVITIQAYGFRALRNVRAFYYTNLSSNSRIKICRAKSSLSGAFSCSITLPPDAEAGPAGIHTIRIRGPRNLDYTTAFVLAP